jgi:crotonobetainyl-CoA:carnitine CoA-transferase CaiB-like acyl-CoA transferase
MNQGLQGPLAGIRVMDVSIMAAGPWTGALLGMLGAEVIKVEPPAGDGTRWVTPTQRGMGTNFIAMNVNKKDIVLDLKSAEGRDYALKLAASCDVFLQNLRVGVMGRLGLDYESLRRLNPGIVYCSVSGFGEEGPLAKAGCADPIMQAFSGFARANGAPGNELEAFRFTGFIDLTTAAVATQAILAALLEREATGAGQHVAVSMLEAALEVQFTRIAELLGAGLVPVPRGSESPAFAPDRAFQTLDREVFVTVCSDAEWKGFCQALERPELAEDARFATNRLRVEHRAALHDLVQPIFRTRPSTWWLRVLQRHGVAAGTAHHFETFRHHQQILANDMIAQIATRDWGELSVGGLPWHFSQTPCAVVEPARPGESNEEVLAALRSFERQPVAGNGRSALKGLRVVEFAEGVAGPLAGLRLGDLGANVVKIEPAEGDWLRGAVPVIPGTGMSAAFFELNRGKRSVLLDSRPEVASAQLKKLLQWADVFITDRSDEALLASGVDVAQEPFALNPRLVIASISALGAHGPLRHYKGSELTAQAMAGYTRYLGKYGEPARRLGADVASAGTAVFACQAILAALLWRERSGKGQRATLSLLNSLLALKSIHLAAQSDPDAYVGPRAGAADYPPESGWKTADQPIYFIFGGSVGAEGRPGWAKFVEEIGAPHLLDDPRFDKTGRNSTGHGIDAHHLKPDYEKVFARYAAQDLVTGVMKYTGSAAVYQRADETMKHPQTRALKIVRQVAAGGGREIAALAFPARFSALQPQLKGVAPELGEHTGTVMKDLGVA